MTQIADVTDEGARMRVRAWCAIGICVAAVLLPVAPATPVGAVQATAWTTTSRLLASLPTGPEHGRGYDRDAFHLWSSSNGCDTRERVLARQNLGTAGGACGASRGRWFSAYDGVQTRNPSTFDIDHVIPLAEAWQSGAFRWTSGRRERFANDLRFRPSLLAVSASSNRSKGEQDPAEWMPPRHAYWCTYLRTWVSVKYRWRLSVDAAERRYLQSHLAACPARVRVPPLAG
jgi:hypothetical protein